MAYKSRLIADRSDLAALIAQTMGKPAAAIYRSGGRFAPHAVRNGVPEAAWHEATRLADSQHVRPNGERLRGHDLKDDRGSAEDRRRRKRYLLDTWGNGTVVPCAFCKAELSYETVTVDRFPIPGSRGGRYTRDNIRPACAVCNIQDQGRAGLAAMEGQK